MGFYPYFSMSLDALNKRFSVGEKPTAAQYQALINACNMLAAMRWSVSVQVGAGWTFSNSGLDIFLPSAGSGRQLFQPFFAAQTASALPGTVYWYTQARAIVLGYTTTTTGSNMAFQGIANNYANKRIFGPLYASSNSTATYRTPANYGCGNLRFSSFTGSSPLVFGVWPYSPNYSTALGVTRYTTSSGALGYGFANNPTATPGLTAGVLRVCEEILDTAETMPVPIGVWPYFTAQSAGESMQGDSLGVCRRMNFNRWVPLTDLGRQRAVWVAIYKPSANVSIYVTVNDYRYTCTTTSTDYRVYTSGTAYYLWAVPIPPEVWAASPRSVAGLPMHFIEISVPSIVYQMSAWVGDAS